MVSAQLMLYGIVNSTFKGFNMLKIKTRLNKLQNNQFNVNNIKFHIHNIKFPQLEKTLLRCIITFQNIIKYSKDKISYLTQL